MIHSIPFLLSTSSCSGCHAVLVFLDSGFCSRYWLIQCNEGIKPPFNWWQGSLFVGWEYSALGERCHFVPPPNTEGYLPITPPMFGLANCDPVPWVVVSILGFTIWWCLWEAVSFPQQNACVPSDIYTHITLPGIFTHLQWMLWQMSTVEVVTSH